jgi:hypothetical protein
VRWGQSKQRRYFLLYNQYINYNLIIFLLEPTEGHKTDDGCCEGTVIIRTSSHQLSLQHYKTIFGPFIPGLLLASQLAN